MSKIIKDIVDDLMNDVEIKPEKSKTVVKWVVRFSGLAIVAAFFIGQFAVNYFNSIENIKTDVSVIKESVIELKKTDERLEGLINKNINDIDKNSEKIFNKK